MRGGTRVMPLIFFVSDTIVTTVIKFAYIMGTSLTKLRLFFHKVSFVIDTIFPPLHEMLYDRSPKTLLKCCRAGHQCPFHLS
jgi:hypothetical protein